MKDLDYGKEYKYAHSFDGHFTDQECMPEKLSGKKFYNSGNNPRENEIRKQLKNWWKDRYGY